MRTTPGRNSCFFWTGDTITGSVNLGRDTDCQAYVAGGTAGALKGVQSVPKEWIGTVDNAAKIDPYTVSKRTLEEEAKGLYSAFKNNIANLR